MNHNENFNFNSDDRFNVSFGSNPGTNVGFGSNSINQNTSFDANEKPIVIDFSSDQNFDARFDFGYGGSHKKCVLYASTAYWNNHPTIISERGIIYVYSDWQKDISGNNIAGFKVGDGNAYLIDMPFVNSAQNIFYDTTANWNAQPSLVSQAGCIYIYSDWKMIEEKPVQGFKIGDGNAYLIDMPFYDEQMWDHINNRIVHITQEEREFWNNKVRSLIDDSHDPEELIFTIH